MTPWTWSVGYSSLPISLLALNEVDVALRPTPCRGCRRRQLEHCALASGRATMATRSSRARHLCPSVIQTWTAAPLSWTGGRQHRTERDAIGALGRVPAVVAATHLDHMVEAERVTQMRHVLRCRLRRRRIARCCWAT